MASVSATEQTSLQHIIGRAEGYRKERKGEHMGVADKETKAYMRENEILCNVINTYKHYSLEDIIDD